MSFQQLEYMTKFNTATFNIVLQWSVKRKQLHVLLNDLPQLIQACQHSKKTPYSSNPQITIVDKTPEIRLAIACEAMVNNLYAMADIAAHFAHKVSKAKISSSFNKLCNGIKSKKVSIEIADILGDLQWYDKIHEIRTEWTHYSSMTIIQDTATQEPRIYIKSYRNEKSKQEFPHDFSCTVNELMHWTRNAQQTINNFGEYLLVEYVVPQRDLKQEIRMPFYDKQGLPIVTKDCLIPSEVITMAEYMKRGRIPEILLNSKKPHLREFAAKILEMCK